MSSANAVLKSISPPMHSPVVRRSVRKAAEECREGEMSQRLICR
jgi:hypothetical protein